LLCIAALQLVNLVRSAQFNEEIARGSLYLISHRLARDPEAIAELSARFDADIFIRPPAEAPEDEYVRSRLERGQVMISTSADGRTAFMESQMPDGGWLSVNLNTVTEVQAQATASLLLEDWQQSGMSLDIFLEKVRPKFGFPLGVVRINELLLSDADFARMQYGDVLVRISIEGSRAEALAKIPGQPLALKLGPIDEFNPYSFRAIFVIVTIGVLLIGLGVYWVVNTFETRLRKLEQATSRLSQGHLNARVNSSGDDPVGRLGRSFNKMAEHIQRLISIQREMVRAVSHELRTPVARIRFGAQIIEDSVMDDPFVSKQLAGMDADIQELDELIDEILTYARLEEGGPILDFQKVNVAEVAEQVVGEARPPAHVTVTYEGADPDNFPFSEVEPRYVHRAIQNLVGNAGRYARSRVKVTCSVADDICRVDVEDDGPGIPEEDWDRVFSAFARLDDSRTRASGGYGLGLSIVRRIMYWHSGRAKVDRSPEFGGARFSLIWPRIHTD
jgi:two-component system sensor histidine kinase RstB